MRWLLFMMSCASLSTTERGHWVGWLSSKMWTLKDPLATGGSWTFKAPQKSFKFQIQIMPLEKKTRTGHLSFHDLTHALACLRANPPSAWKERQRNLPKVPCDGSSERLQLLEVMQHELLSMAKALVQAPWQKNYSLL